MAKGNGNSAGGDDLVDVAGLRPEIADAVLEFRRKHNRITDAQALEELPGVGPATVEQLRTTLDFGDKGQGPRTDNGRERARQETQRETREAAERTTRVATTAARSGAEAA